MQKKDKNNDRIDEEKSEGETTYYVSIIVNNEEFGGNADLYYFYDFYDTEGKTLRKILLFG